MPERRIDFPQTGNSWILIGGAVVLIYTFWQLANSITTGSWKFLALIIVAFIAFFVSSKIARDWRSGVYYFLFWLLFEDLVRKYTSNDMTVYFAKDFLVALVYASFAVSRMRERQKPFHPPFRFALGAFFLLGLIQVLNPHSPSIFYGLLGIKLYYYYIPLMFVGYSMFEDERDLPKFFTFNLAVAAVIAGVAVTQTIVGIDFLNPTGGEDIDAVGHMVRYNHEGQALVRAPGIFVSEGRLQSYMLLAFLLGMAGAGYLLLRSKRSARWIVFPGLGMATLGGLMTGSRGIFIYICASALFLCVGMLWGAPPGRSAGYRLLKAIRRGFVFVAVAILLLIAVFPSAILPRFTYYHETLMPNSQYSELGFRSWSYPLQELKTAFDESNWVIGGGIGTISLGAQYVTRIMNVPRPEGGVENGFGDLVEELGIFGLILWVYWTVSLLAAVIKTTLKLKGTWAFPIALAVTWYAFILLFPLTWGGLTQYQNFVSNAYFWLFIGILFKLPELVRKSTEKEQATGLAA